MKTIAVTEARAHIYEILAAVNAEPEPILLTNRRKKQNAVVISEELWKDLHKKLDLE